MIFLPFTKILHCSWVYFSTFYENNIKKMIPKMQAKQCANFGFAEFGFFDIQKH